DEDNAYRGWDLWFEGGRVGTHIVHKWPTDALKVVTLTPVKSGGWHHLFVTYDGSGKVAGVKIYVDGRLQTARFVTEDRLRSTIRTKVPLKVGQRSRTARLDNMQIHDLRLYRNALSA